MRQKPAAPVAHFPSLTPGAPRVPAAEGIRVVFDNLSTHSVGALYQTLPASEARRVLRRLEFYYYVPKHAS